MDSDIMETAKQRKFVILFFSYFVQKWAFLLLLYFLGGYSNS